ncbi:putative type II DNA modification enzyme [Carbonactinospora thermoautotrophica]|uniref:site-specific DNA-methyltransferase (adenine-specific) n=1 Tax=Carbonactinospora thermoautotrophica TaxID=1469144 RepID=A0A132MMT2_9ACTN|nr:N-6 DNA methylase [Carbonactinospora thermoautotrophica]KWW99035.1 putative type II DNA modification enzyme [Carbonactinospora thermoautotrophica]
MTAATATPRAGFTAVRVVGGLLPADLLARISAGDPALPGNTPADYHLAAGERLGDAASRAWAYLLGAYRAFRDQLAKLPETDRATSLTRERWLQLLFRELGYGRLATTRGITAGDRSYPVSHLWESVPIHLLGWRIDLDRRTPGTAGAAGAAPQSMLQECLNRSDDHLWGVLSNGRLLRILRDSTSLVGSAYVEFDLEAIFDGELYSDFVLLYALLHQSRLENRPVGEDGAPSPAGCWLERWRGFAVEQGTRALDALRDGVTRALEELGTGFLQHPANASLRDRLASGEVSRDDYHRALLRLVYRLLFLFVAEDRDALLDPAADPAARERYERYFSTARLRRIAARRHGDAKGDLWQGLLRVLDGLGAEGGEPRLGLPGLGGLFDDGPLDRLLHEHELPNSALLAAVRALSTVRDKDSQRPRPVDYRNLGSEELGSVYESLLELIPRIDPAARTFRLEQLAGNERKTSGSYYTPASLIECLLDSALDPVLDEAVKDANPERALLEVTVCDPACGSGHFLVAAARRIAKRLAMVRTGEIEPPPEAVRSALREVVAHCVYGVDVNPLAAELAKVSLWLEALEPGKPLAFLDAQIKVGNALLGVTPKLLRDGVPDEAFKALEGDDKKIVASLRKQNTKERSGQGSFFAADVVRVDNHALAEAARGIVDAPVRSLTDVHVQARRLRELESSPELRRAKRVADAWCAAFVWRKAPDAPPAITTDTLCALDADKPEAPESVLTELDRLAEEYRFFHWHLEFPQVFTVDGDDEAADANPDTGWRGGFRVVLGNPPWEKVKLVEKEFFAARDEAIAKAPNKAARDRLIKELPEKNPHLHREFIEAKRRAEGESHLLRSSGRYPLTGRGDVNTYAVFAETGRTLLHPRGRFGMILPTGIATDATTQYFFKDLVESGRLISLFDLVTNPELWSGIGHNRFKFCLLTLGGRGESQGSSEFAFHMLGVRQLADEGVRYRLTAEEIILLNPNTGTCPVFRSRRDAEVTLDIYRRVPVLLREGDPDGNPWCVSFMAMFHMSNDSRLFRTREELESDGWELDGNVFVKGEERMLPLYEAKMLHHYDHRFGTYMGRSASAEGTSLPRVTPEQHDDPDFAVLPRYWVAAELVDEQLAKKGWDRGWLLGWRDICRATDERTMIASLFPRAGIGHTFPLLFMADATKAACLLAMFSSFAFDYIARQKIAGTHLTYNYLNQTAVLRPEDFEGDTPWSRGENLRSWITSRVLELAYTSWDLSPFAADHGYNGPPFRWDEERRFLLRAELDAAFFHLYGVDRDDVDYVLDSFRAFRNNDPERFARTKATILEIYDAMAKAAETGEPYRTVLDPPPGEGPRHPASKSC